MEDKSRYAIYWRTRQRRALEELERLAKVARLWRRGVYTRAQARSRFCGDAATTPERKRLRFKAAQGALR